MMEDPRNITNCASAVLRQESSASVTHATNIAETIYYMTTGAQPDGVQKELA